MRIGLRLGCITVYLHPRQNKHNPSGTLRYKGQIIGPNAVPLIEGFHCNPLLYSIDQVCRGLASSGWVRLRIDIYPPYRGERSIVSASLVLFQWEERAGKNCSFRRKNAAGSRDFRIGAVRGGAIPAPHLHYRRPNRPYSTSGNYEVRSICARC